MEHALMPPKTLPFWIGALLILCLAFAWQQNHFQQVGGAISVPKTLWLFLALCHFYLIPAWLWQDKRLDNQTRNLYGFVLLAFVIRGVIEIPILYFSNAWRVGYGIAHNIAVLLFVLCFAKGLYMRKHLSSARGNPLANFLPLLMTALVFESINAWLFSRKASPAAGQYFASSDVSFAWINRITWFEIAILLPAMILWLIAHQKGPRIS